MGICDTPQVINAPRRQPITDPAAAINAPCHIKIALMSLRRYPIERKMAIYLIFASTDIVRTLKIPKPANRMMSETVMATDMLNVRKS